MICFTINILSDFPICLKEILPNIKGWLGLNSFKRLVPKMLIKALISDNSLIPIESPIKEVKQIFIYLIKIFQQYQLLEDEGLLITNGSRINIDNLPTYNISDGIILYENFNTHSFLTKEV
jgi:hypothetical protein